MRLYEVKIKDRPNDEETKKFLTMGKRAANAIKKNCQPFLSETSQKLYRGMYFKSSQKSNHLIDLEKAQHKDLFFKKSVRKQRERQGTSEALSDSLNQILVILNSPVRRENVVHVTGDISETGNYGNAFIIFPIGEFDIAWSDTIKDPSSFDQGESPMSVKYEKINPEKEKEERDNFEFEVREKMIYQLTDDFLDSIEAEWREHYQQIADQHFNDLADNDPDKYDEEQKQKIINSWIEAHIDELEKEFLKQEYQEKFASEVKEKIDSEIDNFRSHYFDFDSNKFIEDMAKTYHTDDLDAAIDSENEIMIKCDNYYAIDPLFFESFVEEHL